MTLQYILDIIKSEIEMEGVYIKPKDLSRVALANKFGGIAAYSRKTEIEGVLILYVLNFVDNEKMDLQTYADSLINADLLYERINKGVYRLEANFYDCKDEETLDNLIMDTNAEILNTEKYLESLKNKGDNVEEIEFAIADVLLIENPELEDRLNQIARERDSVKNCNLKNQFLDCYNIPLSILNKMLESFSKKIELTIV